EARALYVAMDVVTRFVIVPLCAASLASGVLASLVTPWGLVRHYWVVVKLALTLGATAVLALHTTPIHEAARLALDTANVFVATRLRWQLALDAGAALVVLAVITVLGVEKPRGETGLARPR